MTKLLTATTKVRTIVLSSSFKRFIPETGIEETRVLTKISPGHFKMISKLKKDGMIMEQELKFTEFGVTAFVTIAGITATIIYK